jgi:hypothetical protein
VPLLMSWLQGELSKWWWSAVVLASAVARLMT